jgi:hypothetical protein
MQRVAPAVRLITVCTTVIVALLLVPPLPMVPSDQPDAWFRLATMVLLWAGSFAYVVALTGLIEGTRPWWRPLGGALALLLSGTGLTFVATSEAVPVSWGPVASAALGGVFALAGWISFEYLVRRAHTTGLRAQQA